MSCQTILLAAAALAVLAAGGVAGLLAVAGEREARACEAAFAEADAAVAADDPARALAVLAHALEGAACPPTASALASHGRARARVVDLDGTHLAVAAASLARAAEAAPGDDGLRLEAIAARMAAGDRAGARAAVAALADRPDAPAEALQMAARLALAEGDAARGAAYATRLAEAGADDWRIDELAAALDHATGLPPAERALRAAARADGRQGAAGAVLSLVAVAAGADRPLPDPSAFAGADRDLLGAGVVHAVAAGAPGLAARLAAGLPAGDARRRLALEAAFRAGDREALAAGIGPRPVILAREPAVALLARLAGLGVPVETGVDTELTRRVAALLALLEGPGAAPPGPLLDAVVAAQRALPASAEPLLVEAAIWLHAGETVLAAAATAKAARRAPGAPLVAALGRAARAAAGRGGGGAAGDGPVDRVLAAGGSPRAVARAAAAALGLSLADMSAEVAATLAAPADAQAREARLAALLGDLSPAWRLERAFRLLAVEGGRPDEAALSAAALAVAPILERAPDHPGARVATALVRAHLGDGLSLVEGLRRVATLAPARTGDALRLTLALVGPARRPVPAGILVEAWTAATRAEVAAVRGGDPDEAVVARLSMLAGIAEAAGDAALAEAAYRSILARAPDSHAALNNLAVHLSRRREALPEAARLAARAFALSPGTGAYRETVAEVAALAAAAPDPRATVPAHALAKPAAGDDGPGADPEGAPSGSTP